MFVLRVALLGELLCLLSSSAHALRLSRSGACHAAAFSAFGLVCEQRALASTPDLTYEILTGPTDPTSAVPARGQKVAVDYSLWLNSFEGKLIDSSKGSAFPPRLPSPFVFSVGVGEVIPGWDRAVRTMRVGEKRRLIVPPSLAYGDRGIGPIPGGATLYFEVELLELRSLPKFTDKQLEWLATHPEP